MCSAGAPGYGCSRPDGCAVCVNAWIDRPILVREVVIVPNGDEGAQFELGGSRASESVLDHSRILAVHHENSFLELDAVHDVREDRERIESEPLENTMSIRMDHTGIPIRRELMAVTIENQRLFKLRQQHHRAHRRPHRRHEQSVIAPRVQTEDGR